MVRGLCNSSQVWCMYICDCLEETGFSRSVFAYDGEYLPWIKRKADIPKDTALSLVVRE